MSGPATAPRDGSRAAAGRPGEAGASAGAHGPGRVLRIHAEAGAILDRCFLPDDCAAVDVADDPDVVALATGWRTPLGVQLRIARARRRFGWRPLLVAHYGEIGADPAANAADLDAVFSFAPTAGRNCRHERYWHAPALRAHLAAREALDPSGLWARPKTRFCNFVARNAATPGTAVREAFVRMLTRRRRVDCPGRVLRNAAPLAPGVPAKLDYLASYRFTVAFENTSAEHYVTEKIVHALAAGSVPVYWGCPRIAEYYNPDAFVNCHAFASLEEAAERVLAIDADPALLDAMRRAPPLRPGSRVRAAHADLRSRWRTLAADAAARRGTALTPEEARRRWLALLRRGTALALDPRPPLGAARRLSTLARAWLARRADRMLQCTRRHESR